MLGNSYSQGNVESNEIYVLRNYLHMLRYEVDDLELETYLLSHHSFPSFPSITDYLRYKQINYTLKGAESACFEDMVPSIVYIEGVIAIVLGVDNGIVRYLHPFYGKRAVESDVFRRSLSSEAVLNVQVQGKGWYMHRNWMLFLLVVFISTLLLEVERYALTDVILFLMNLMGVFTCFTLFKLKHKDGFWNHFCSAQALGEFRISCKTIINSKYSRIFGLDAIDAGMTLFASLILMLLVFDFESSSGILTIYCLVLVCALPFSITSFIYQFRAKAICTHCVIANSLIFLELLVIQTAVSLGAIFTFKGIYVYLLLLIATVLLTHTMWIVAKKHLIRHYGLESSRIKFLALKRKPEIASRLLGDVVRFPDSGLDLNISSSQDLTDSVLLVLSFGCSHCIKVLESYFFLVNSVDRLSLTVRFVGLSRNDLSELINFMKSLKNQRLRTLVWSHFNSKYRSCTDEEIDFHNRLANHPSLRQIPQVFFNFRRVDDHFEPDDLRYFISIENRSAFLK